MAIFDPNIFDSNIFDTGEATPTADATGGMTKSSMQKNLMLCYTEDDTLMLAYPCEAFVLLYPLLEDGTINCAIMPQKTTS